MSDRIHHAEAEQELIKRLDTSKNSGLSQSEAARRLEKHGPNSLREQASVPIWEILWQQLRSMIVLLLAVATAVSFFLGETLEGFAILAVLIINTLIGFAMEYRAMRSMEALRKLGRTASRIRRDGKSRNVDASELVPGDILLFEGGDVIAADARLLEASGVEVDESTLTGESLPVRKEVLVLPESTVLAERVNMLFKGTSIANGSGRAVVVATGMASELGHIADLTYSAKQEVTPLEKRLDRLGQKLVWVSLALVLLVCGAGMWAGKDLLLMFETAVALAVATIPEGLPIVATIALAKGMWRMADKNALVNRLSAVETLGATTVILTDKTGTLTENRMSVAAFELGSGHLDWLESEKAGLSEDTQLALRLGALCTNAEWGGGPNDEGVGDPMEVALLRAASAGGMSLDQLRSDFCELGEEAFSPDTKMMATWHRDQGEVLVAVKGAPEAVIEVSNLDAETKKQWIEKNEELASKGFRVLGLAWKRSATEPKDPYADLTFHALVGLADPPRAGVKEAIEKCRTAGIEVVMVTGDQVATAKSIGRKLGLGEMSVFSRVSPEQKLRLVEERQAAGEVVAMTGDGVNDAPALKKSDIGIAMGMRGTQVAREAADLVLKDDNFTTIVDSVKYGRVVFSNIRRFVVYLLSCNISEVLIVSVATLMNAPLPIFPIQILFLNLVTDVFPALALGMGEGDESYLTEPPRPPKEAIITTRHWYEIAGYGIVMTFSVLGSFLAAIHYLGADEQRAVTISFLTLAFSQLFHVFNMQHRGSNPFFNDVTRNGHVWGAVGLCCVLLYGSVSLEWARTILSTAELDPRDWSWVMLWSLIPLVLGQAYKFVLR